MSEQYSLYGSITPGKLRQLNPGIQVNRLYVLSVKNPTLTTTEYMSMPLTVEQIDANGWWLLDADGGFTYETGDQGGTGSRYLDVGKPGFKEAYVQSLLSRLEGKGYDGVVLDYLNPNMISNRLIRQGFTPPAQYPDDQAWFTNAWQPFLSHVVQSLRARGYRVIGNCAGEYSTTNPYAQWQRSILDGTVYEQWAVGWPQDGGDWLPGHIIERRINTFSQDPLEAWTADYGLRSNLPEYAAKARAGLAMYYIALPDSISMRANKSYHHYRDSRVYQEPLWDFYIGEPSEPRNQKQDKYFWSRKFTKGIVLLNYEAGETIAFQLDKTYMDPAGNKVSGQINVPPYTGLILGCE